MYASRLAVDHSKIYYTPFRKNYYVEVPDLARITQEEVHAYRQELDGIRVVGRDVQSQYELGHRLTNHHQSPYSRICSIASVSRLLF